MLHHIVLGLQTVKTGIKLKTFIKKKLCVKVADIDDLSELATRIVGA